MRRVLYILGALHDEDMQWLVDVGQVRTEEAGAEIIREGGSVDSLFILLEGSLLVSRGGVEIASLSSGEVVGETSFLDSRPTSATVTASTPITIFAVPRATLRSKLDRDTAFGARFYRAVCLSLVHRLDRTNQLLAAKGDGASATEEPDPEMSVDMLDTVALAGARFDWFRKRLLGAKGT